MIRVITLRLGKTIAVPNAASGTPMTTPTVTIVEGLGLAVNGVSMPATTVKKIMPAATTNRTQPTSVLNGLAVSMM
jgi:hypothetical protein